MPAFSKLFPAHVREFFRKGPAFRYFRILSGPCTRKFREKTQTCRYFRLCLTHGARIHSQKVDTPTFPTFPIHSCGNSFERVRHSDISEFFWLSHAKHAQKTDIPTFPAFSDPMMCIFHRKTQPFRHFRPVPAHVHEFLRTRPAVRPFRPFLAHGEGRADQTRFWPETESFSLSPVRVVFLKYFV